MQVAATYSATFLTTTAKVVENAKTLQYSMVDVLTDPTTNKPYPTTIDQAKADLGFFGLPSVWADKFWTVDILKLFGIDLASYTKYYGKNKVWFRFSLFDESNNSHLDQVLWDIIALFQ